MVDAAGTIKYTYKLGGLLWTEDGPWGSDTVTNLYNSARLWSGLVLQQPTGTWTNGFSYDAAHRLSNVVFSAGTFVYSYKVGQASRLPIKLTLPNTSYITNAYDNVGRLTETRLLNNLNTTLNKHLYLYNTGNQRIRHTRTDDSYYTNNYDNIGQLTWADSTVANEYRGYLYDAAWNLNKRTNNAGVTTFGVDVKNQLTNGPGATFVYDSNGNLSSSESGNRNFSYDAENQLSAIEVIVQGLRWEFVYDGRGRLRKQINLSWNGSSWSVTGETRYVYDGMRVIQDRDSSNTPTVSYTRGSDLSGSLEGAGGIGGLLARSHGYSGGNWSTHNYYHADGGGNITMLIDASQVTVASYRYDPFGNTVSSSGTLASTNVFRFSSKAIHAFTGIYYYGYRFYDPNLQRWPNRDPVGDEASFASMLIPHEEYGPVELWDRPNIYGFVYNNPVVWIDAYGLYTFGEWLDIIGAGFGGAGQGLAAELDGAIPFFDPFSRFYDPCDPTFKFSKAMGATAATALSGAGALRAAGISTKIAYHSTPHPFGPLGRLPHLQLNWWRAGVKGSGGAVRVPLPPISIK